MLIRTSLEGDRRVLGQDRDAAFTFQVVGVHDLVDDLFVFAENTALPQHDIDQGGLAVVNVGDDGDIAQIFISYDTSGLPPN